MTPDFPQDDQSRIPRSKREQLEQLAKMFGEAEPLPTPAPQRRAAKKPGAVVTFELKWNVRRSRGELKRMSAEEYEAYERARTEAQAYVGKHVRHFERPFAQWTGDDLTSLVADMLATVRACPKKPGGDSRVYLSFCRFNGYGRRDRLDIFVNCGTDYHAEVDIRPVAIPDQAWAEFVSGFAPEQITVDEQKRGVAMKVSAYKSATWLEKHPTTIASDDEDNDQIERAALRTLNAGSNADRIIDANRIRDIALRLSTSHREWLRRIAESFEESERE